MSADPDSPFDEVFRERLVRVLLDESLPLDFNGAGQSVGVNQDTMRLIHKFNRKIMSWILQLRQFDLLGDFEFKLEQPPMRKGLARARRQNQAPTNWTLKSIRYLHIVCLIYYLINTYYMYVYDMNMIRLGHLKRRPEAEPYQDGGESSRLHELELKVSAAHATLKSLGASHIQWTFIPEFSFVIMAALAFVGLVVIPSLDRLTDVVQVALRGAMDRENEARLWAYLVVRELQILAVSSFRFHLTRLEAFVGAIPNLRHLQGDSINRRRHHGRGSLLWQYWTGSKLHQRHGQTISALRRLALEGRFNQLTRVRGGTDRLALRIFALILTISFCFLGFFPSIYLWARFRLELRGIQVELDSPQDVLEFAVLIFLISTMIFVDAILLNTLNDIALMDLLEGSNCLLALTSQIIDKNQVRINRLSQPRVSPALSQTMFGQLDNDLLVIIVQRRLLGRHFKLVYRHLSWFALFLLGALASVPFILHIHTAYMDTELRSRLHITAFVTMVGHFSMLLIPIAMLHSRGVTATGRLWTLLAQVSQFESLGREKSMASLTLRREMTDLGEKDKMFACHVLSMPVTYQNLIRIAFWATLCTVSLTNGMIGRSTYMTRLMTDPLGLYSD